MCSLFPTQAIDVMLMDLTVCYFHNTNASDMVLFSHEIKYHFAIGLISVMWIYPCTVLFILHIVIFILVCIIVIHKIEFINCIMLDNASLPWKCFTVLCKIKIERKGFVPVQLKMYTLSGYFYYSIWSVWTHAADW